MRAGTTSIRSARSSGVDRKRALGVVSAVQLSAGVAGLALAVRRQHAYDIPLLHGHPHNVARDSVIMGTALSAPGVMLGVQTVATVRVLRGDVQSARLLGGLGVVMTAGYLAEKLVRRRLRPSGWDALETPVVVIGLGTAAFMAVLAVRGRAEGR